MDHVGADGECLYVVLYMNYNEVYNTSTWTVFGSASHPHTASRCSDANTACDVDVTGWLGFVGSTGKPY